MPKTVVVGAGPIGLYCAIIRARAGDEVIVVDRDGGPVDGDWQRRGVMQFRHPHFFRPAVRRVFEQTAPDLWDAVVGAGGIPAHPPGAPEFVTGLQSRRSTFEQAIRGAAAAEPRVTLRTGHADAVEIASGQVTGLVVDGGRVDADLLIDATGRAGKLGDDLRPAGQGGPCGFSYVSRMYEVLDDAAAEELAGYGYPLAKLHEGYLVIVFPQDARTLSALIVRASDDDALAQVRHTPNCATGRPTTPRWPQSRTWRNGPSRAGSSRSPMCFPAAGSATRTAARHKTSAACSSSVTACAPRTRRPVVGCRSP